MTSENSPTITGLRRFGALPMAAAALVLLNGLYMALLALGNITDFGANQAFVQHVLAMDTTNFGAEPGTNLDPDVMWRAIENTTVQNIAYVLVMVWETATALVLLAAAWLWFTDRDQGFEKARSLSTVGLLMLLLLFFGGFIAIGGEWFQMWKSDAWNGLEPAFRNSVLAIGTLILVHMTTPNGNASGRTLQHGPDRSEQVG